MKEKKNIDRLFQEKFKDFEAHPSDRVWQGIVEKRKKKKSRIIPLWLKLGGAAAILLLFLFIGNNILKNTGQNSPEVVETPSEINEGDNQELISEDSKEIISQESEIADSEEVISNNTVGSSKSSNSGNISPEEKGNIKIVENENVQQNLNNRTKTALQTENAIAQTPDSGIDTSIYKEANNERETFSSQTTGITNSNREETEKSNKFSDSSSASEAIAQNKAGDEENKEVSDAGSNKKSLLDAINEKELNESELAENEENDDEEVLKRWGVSPTIAPVYYNSFAGSGIDPQFKDNAKDGEVNMSYGLQVSYAVNNKLTIRSGINKVDLSYSTSNIQFSPDIQARSLKSINYNENSAIIEVIDKSAVRTPASIQNEVQSKSAFTTGSLNQSLGYYEVPMELEYALINEKFGLQLIGGLSTLFLDKNEIAIDDGDLSTPLGSSNSLNDVSFSTNVGLGIDYKISKQFQFNLEPMFKYQLNAYKNEVSDFKPYYLGLYTGVSIKF